MVQRYITANGIEDLNALISYAYNVSATIGEGAAALACQMYDEVASASGVAVPAAVPAEVADYGEVAAAVTEVSRTSPIQLPSVAGRFVKRQAADTTLFNAQRDGAQFAWVPHGDTCAFCITLASRGWQYMSKKALKNGHAEHIHNNCDCEYAIRFDTSSTVEGYDPQVYKDMYYGAEGHTPKERINAMRREIYAENTPKILAKRATYAARKEREIIEKTNNSGIINVEADGMTPCLVDNKTGDILNTSVTRVTNPNELREYTKKSGWFINWREIAKEDGIEVYKLILDRDNSVQGLTAITPQRGYVYLNWGVANPLSQSDRVGAENKQFSGIGGHLFAIAAQRSKDLGNGGYLMGCAADAKVEHYYIREFGAHHLGVIHPYQFEIDEAASEKILSIYDFDMR